MTIRSVFILGLLLVSCQTSRSLAAFTITEYSAEARVVEPGNGGEVSDSIGSPTDPSGSTAYSASTENNSSTTTVLWSISGDSANLNVDISHVRGSEVEGSTAFSTFVVKFQVSVPSYFIASGFYHLIDPSAAENTVTVLSSSLHNGVGDTIFNSRQISNEEPASFDLGGSAGNINNIVPESLEGYLEPVGLDHWYEWIGIVSTLAQQTDSPVLAGGSLLLTITPVPEAASFIVWSISLAMICAVGGRHRSKARVIN